MTTPNTIPHFLVGRWCRTWAHVPVGIAAIGMVIPSRGAAQTDVIMVREVRGVVRDTPFRACIGHLPTEDAFLARVAEALALPDKESADQALRELEPDARHALAGSPDSLNARYRLAVIVGARSDLVGGRTKVRLANELHALATQILDIETDHPGAHYMLGRLHAGVMRMGRLERFLARNILGGAALNEASWDGAQRHLEAAESQEPCIPDHHYELARVYLDRGDTDAAQRELEHTLQLVDIAGERWNRLGSRAAALQSRTSQR